MSEYYDGLPEEDKPYFELGMAQLVREAAQWITDNQIDPSKEYFEDVAKRYPPALFTALNHAWCEMFGGI
jgi:hypothetical protein